MHGCPICSPKHTLRASLLLAFFPERSLPLQTLQWGFLVNHRTRAASVAIWSTFPRVMPRRRGLVLYLHCRSLNPAEGLPRGQGPPLLIYSAHLPPTHPSLVPGEGLEVSFREMPIHEIHTKERGKGKEGSTTRVQKSA